MKEKAVRSLGFSLCHSGNSLVSNVGSLLSLSGFRRLAVGIAPVCGPLILQS